MIAKLKQWIQSHGTHPREEAKKEELRKPLFGENNENAGRLRAIASLKMTMASQNQCSQSGYTVATSQREWHRIRQFSNTVL